MKELRLIRAYVGPLAEISISCRARTYRVKTECNGVVHIGAGSSLTQAHSRLLESLRGYPSRFETL